MKIVYYGTCLKYNFLANFLVLAEMCNETVNKKCLSATCFRQSLQGRADKLTNDREKNGKSSTETFQFHRRTLQYLKLKFLECLLFYQTTNERKTICQKFMITEILYFQFFVLFYFFCLRVACFEAGFWLRTDLKSFHYLWIYVAIFFLQQSHLTNSKRTNRKSEIRKWVAVGCL